MAWCENGIEVDSDIVDFPGEKIAVKEEADVVYRDSFAMIWNKDFEQVRGQLFSVVLDFGRRNNYKMRL